MQICSTSLAFYILNPKAQAKDETYKCHLMDIYQNIQNSQNNDY